MLLKDKIIQVKPREKAGSISSSRYDFQKDWSICKLLELHQNTSDYLIVFDWLEDLIIMDCEYDPQKIEFFQIKGKKAGHWSVKDLIRSEQDKNGNPLLSIIGKLYDCKLKLEMETTSLNFVSNARFNIELKDKSKSITKDDICILELTDREKAKISQKIKEEHFLTHDPDFENITFFKVLDLSLNDSKIHTQGILTQFFEHLYPGKKLNAPTIYKILFDEVKRRTNYNKDILTYEDLIKNKAISKDRFDKIIVATGINTDYYEIWKQLELILLNEGLGFHQSQIFKKSWTQLEIERMDPNNDYLNRIILQIRQIIKQKVTESSFKILNLLQSTEAIFANFMIVNTSNITYDDNFIKVLIISELYE